MLLLWFIFICYNIYNVCLLHDFVATLEPVRSALCIVFCFVQASTVTISLQQLPTLLPVRLNVLFYVSHFHSYYSLFLSYNRSWGQGWDPVKSVLDPPPRILILTVSSVSSVVVPYCYLFLLSVFILWFTYYVSVIF